MCCDDMRAALGLGIVRDVGHEGPSLVVRDSCNDPFIVPLHHCIWCGASLREGKNVNIPIAIPRNASP